MLAEQSIITFDRAQFDRELAQLSPVAISILFETKDCDILKFSHVLEYFITTKTITSKEKSQLVKHFLSLQEKPDSYGRWTDPSIVKAAQREVIQPEILEILNITTNAESFKLQIFQTLLHKYERDNLAIISHEKFTIFTPPVIYIIVCSVCTISVGVMLYLLANRSLFSPPPAPSFSENKTSTLVTKSNPIDNSFRLGGFLCLFGGGSFGFLVIVAIFLKAIGNYLNLCPADPIPEQAQGTITAKSSASVTSTTDTDTMQQVLRDIQKAQLLLTLFKDSALLQCAVRSGQLSFTAISTFVPAPTFPLYSKPTPPPHQQTQDWTLQYARVL